MIVTPPPVPDFSHKHNVPWRLIIWVSSIALCFGCCLSIVLPEFACARYASENTACLSNIKQSGMGVLMYSTDHDDRFPPAAHWMDLARLCVESDDVFHCPKLRKEDPDAYGYATVAGLSGTRERDLESPPQEPLLFESVLTYRNAHGPIKGFPNPPRHGTADAVCFADGHVTRLRPEDAAKLQVRSKEKRP